GARRRRSGPALLPPSPRWPLPRVSPLPKDGGWRRRLASRRLMAHESLTLEQLAAQLGRDLRAGEKLVGRGRIPGRRVEGEWRFARAEIRKWREQERGGSRTEERAGVEESQRPDGKGVAPPLRGVLMPETVQAPRGAGPRHSVLESLLEVAGRTWQVW